MWSLTSSNFRQTNKPGNFRTVKLPTHSIRKLPLLPKLNAAESLHMVNETHNYFIFIDFKNKQTNKNIQASKEEMKWHPNIEVVAL